MKSETRYILELWNDSKTWLGETTPVVDLKRLSPGGDIYLLMPAIRMTVSETDMRTVEFTNNELIGDFMAEEDAVLHKLRSFLPSSHTEFLNSCLLILDLERSGDDQESWIIGQLNGFYQANGNFPLMILIRSVGLIVIGEHSAMCSVLAEIFQNYIRAYKQHSTKVDQLKTSDVSEATYWPEGAAGHVSQKNILITGGAQGLGEGMVRELFSNGANVVVADINEAMSMALTDELNARGTINKTYFVKTDVTDPVSVVNMVKQCTLKFGGIDVLISNAGILTAGGLDEMEPETLDKVTRVNYYGYYHCVKYASAVMKVQTKYKPGYYADIIQISSKSGLRGSNRNFAYAGSKFGGIGLTQSFALELIDDRIKVNSICPGNFFEGPLWSDPEKGLFVQYLRAGKVPGAKTIEEVKKYYEQKVPMKKGCSVQDITKAIFYLIDQTYETGQALPVTGGQVMLH